MEMWRLGVGQETYFEIRCRFLCVIEHQGVSLSGMTSLPGRSPYTLCYYGKKSPCSVPENPRARTPASRTAGSRDTDNSRQLGIQRPNVASGHEVVHSKRERDEPQHAEKQYGVGQHLHWLQNQVFMTLPLHFHFDRWPLSSCTAVFTAFSLPITVSSAVSVLCICAYH